MTKKWLEESILAFYHRSQEKYLPQPSPLPLSHPGALLCEEPLLGYGAATDPMFIELQKPHIVGPQYRPPLWWLPEGKSVISIFLPFSQTLRSANAQHEGGPAPEWLHGRIEGHRFLQLMARHVAGELKGHGYKAVVPDGRVLPEIADPRFSMAETDPYRSNWSERHVAYVCGMGTFSLSCALITEKGCAGRFCNIVTDLELEPTPRQYQRFDERCIQCGLCADNCPAHAISPTKGKDHALCSAFLDGTRIAPYYGCGKCQTGVPCEHSIP